MLRTLTRVAWAVVPLAAVGCSMDPDGPPPVTAQVTRLEKTGGDNQAGEVGEELPNQVEVRVVDATGAVVRDHPVHFAVYSGAGSVAPAATTTDQSGVARATWTLGTHPISAHQVSARLLNHRGGVVDVATFAATAAAGPATSITKESGDLQRGQPGGAVHAPLVVSVKDRFGNPKPTASVAWAVVSGGGTLSTTASWTDGIGHARNRLTLGPDTGTHTVRASLENGQEVIFTARAVTAAAPGGVIERSDPLAARPYGAAISSHDAVYITQLDNQRLSRINLPTLGEAGSVTVGSTPTDVAFNATGTRAYTANQFGSNISVVDVATNTVVSVIGVSGNPFEVIPSADDTRLYVVTNLNRIYEIDRATGAELGSVPIPGTGQSLAFHPNGYLLYTSTFTGGQALEVDTRTMTVTRSFITGGLAQEVVVSFDGTELFVADQTLQKVDVFSLATGDKIASIPVGGNAWGMAMTPDQSQVYVSLLFQGEVAVIDRATRSIVRRIPTGGVPRRIVFNAAGTIAVVTNESGFVTYIR